MRSRPLRTMGVVALAWALGIGPLAAAPTASDLRFLLAVSAERQIGVTRAYDPQYRKLPYPGGDVSPDTGVCADVVVRAFRGIGVDLQIELHEDMKKAFRAYPQAWGLPGPDPSIDHRRVRNLIVFFKRKGKSLPLHAPFQTGDVVAWKLRNGLYHIGVVSSYRAQSGRPMVVHNIGRGARVEDVLDRFPRIGHYRW